MAETVFFEQPGYRVTSRMIIIGGQPIPMDQVYTAEARPALGSLWSARTWLSLLKRQPPHYELRMLTSAGRQAIPLGTNRELAEHLAAAIAQAIRPPHWPS